jgi:hypothetical protein
MGNGQAPGTAIGLGGAGCETSGAVCGAALTRETGLAVFFFAAFTLAGFLAGFFLTAVLAAFLATTAFLRLPDLREALFPAAPALLRAPDLRFATGTFFAFPFFFFAALFFAADFFAAMKPSARAKVD